MEDTESYVFVKGRGLDPYTRFLEALVQEAEKVVLETVKLNSLTLKGVREDRDSVKLRERLESLSDSSSENGEKLVFEGDLERLENVVKGTLREENHLLTVLDYFVADGKKMYVETRPADPGIDSKIEITEETAERLNIKLRDVEACILPETGFSWSNGEDVYTVEGRWLKGPDLKIDILDTRMETKGMNGIETVPDKRFLERFRGGGQQLFFESSIERDRVLSRFKEMKNLYSSSM